MDIVAIVLEILFPDYPQSTNSKEEVKRTLSSNPYIFNSMKASKMTSLFM